MNIRELKLRYKFSLFSAIISFTIFFLLFITGNPFFGNYKNSLHIIIFDPELYIVPSIAMGLFALIGLVSGYLFEKNKAVGIIAFVLIIISIIIFLLDIQF